jgi:hypothetical protein
MSAEKKDSYKRDDVAGRETGEGGRHVDEIRIYRDGRVNVSCPEFGNYNLPMDLSAETVKKINEIIDDAKSNKPAMVTSSAFRERYDQINWSGRKGNSDLN